MQKLQAIPVGDNTQRKQALQSALGQVSNTYANMTKDQKTTPIKTTGGAIASAGGGALAGAMMAKEIGLATGNPYAIAGGAALGLLSYYL